MSLTLAAILAESATRYPDRDAVVIGPQRISYATLWEQTRRYAAVLREAGHRAGRPGRPADAERAGLSRAPITPSSPWARSSCRCTRCWWPGRSASC